MAVVDLFKGLYPIGNVIYYSAAPKGYKGGRTYKNIPLEAGAQKLPEGVNYKEYDINPYVKGQNRGAERIVIGDDGSVWYTDDHYYTFTKIE